jgi:hypothetical protein
VHVPGERRRQGEPLEADRQGGGVGDDDGDGEIDSEDINVDVAKRNRKQ